MAQSGNGGVIFYAGFIIIVMVALAAFAAFKLNLGGIGDMLSPDDPVSRPTSPDRPGNAGGNRQDPQPRQVFSTTPPDRPEYAVKHDKPLPETLTIRRSVGEYETTIDLCLVPQGWFIMGADDGIDANGPRRWVWLDDYYIAKTEITNSQYYSFILGNGYRESRWWTQEGITYIRDSVQNRGTDVIGWTAIDPGRRVWALASPDDRLVLEVQDAEKGVGRADTTVLVLPDGLEYGEYLHHDRHTGSVRLKFRDNWRDVSGADVRRTAANDEQFRLKQQGLLHTTDMYGLVDFESIPTAEAYTVIAWADGDTEKPIIADIRRGTSHYLRGPDIPVVGVSWFEADACARFFGGLLPTEAQWEKAGRGPEGRIFPWGNDLEMTAERRVQGVTRQTTDRANLNRGRLEPVGNNPEGASQYGVHDLVGNVTEWCRDVFAKSPKWDERNPHNRGGAQEPRSLRGTKTDDDDPQTAKLHHRRMSDPYDRRTAYNRGFRIVLDPQTALNMAR
jgi:formylglycine-generating enzyme required for sulfatase activity